MLSYRVKHRLHEMLHSGKDFEEEDFTKVCKNFLSSVNCRVQYVGSELRGTFSCYIS